MATDPAMMAMLGVWGDYHHRGVQQQSFSTPPWQTDVQHELFASKQHEAQAASSAAHPKLVAFFGTAEVRHLLERCCPAVANLSSEALVERFRNEVRVAELAHSFPATETTRVFADITIGYLARFEWVLNPWQVQLVEKIEHPDRPLLSLDKHFPFVISNLSLDWPQRLAEPYIFGSPTFARGQATWDTAAHRMVYVASNIRRADEGGHGIFGQVSVHPTHRSMAAPVLCSALENLGRGVAGVCSSAHRIRGPYPSAAQHAYPGTVFIAESSFYSLARQASLIFRTGSVRNLALLSAVDTGVWEGSCNNSRRGPHIQIDCSTELPPLGTIDHLDHLILPNLRTWRFRSSTGGMNSMSRGAPSSTLLDEAAALFSRSPLAGDYARVPNASRLEFLKYYEAPHRAQSGVPAALALAGPRRSRMPRAPSPLACPRLPRTPG